MEEEEMGETCRIYEEEVQILFLRVNMKGTDTMNTTQVAGHKIMVKQIGWEGTEWFHLAQNMDYWWALMRTVINHHVL